MSIIAGKLFRQRSSPAVYSLYFTTTLWTFTKKWFAPKSDSIGGFFLPLLHYVVIFHVPPTFSLIFLQSFQNLFWCDASGTIAAKLSWLSCGWKIGLPAVDWEIPWDFWEGTWRVWDLQSEGISLGYNVM